MKKHSATGSTGNIYCVKESLDDIGLISSIVTGKSALINLKTNKLINEIDYYENKLDKENHFFYQKKTIDIDDDTSTVRKIKEEIEVISIYDTYNKKMIFDEYQIIDEKIYDGNGYWFGYKFAVIKSRSNGKYYIFDSKMYNKSPEIFSKGYDEIEKINDFSYFITSLDKTGVYTIGVGLVADIEYDSIIYYKTPWLILFTKGDKKYFSASSFSKKSSGYDDIKIEKIEETDIDSNVRLIYCKNASETSIFILDSSMSKNNLCLLFKTECEDIKFLNFIKKNSLFSEKLYGEYFFKITKDSKYGLVKCVMEETKTPIFKLLVEPIYDDIVFSGRTYYLYKDSKVGVIDDSSIFINNTYLHNVSLIEAKHDNVQKLDNGFYIFNETNKFFISKINDLNNHVLEFDNVISIYKNTVIYIRNGKYGIFSSSENKTYDLFGYDEIKHRGRGYFEITEGKKKGIWFNNKIIIPPKYVSIDLHDDCMSNYMKYADSGITPLYSCKYLKENNRKEFEYVFFALETTNLLYDRNWYKLIKISNDGSSKIRIMDKIEKIDFLENVIVIKKRNNTYIYNYKGKLSMTLSNDSQISYIEHIEKHGWPSNDTYTPIYIIDGEYYFYLYETNSFEKANIIEENTQFYMTAYECEYGTIVVNSYSKEHHEEKCREIESMGEFEIEETMLSYYDDDDDIKIDYPKYVKRRGIK